MGNISTWKITHPSATLSTTNPILTDLQLNLGLHSERSVTNCLINNIVKIIYAHRTNIKINVTGKAVKGVNIH